MMRLFSIISAVVFLATPVLAAPSLKTDPGKLVESTIDQVRETTKGTSGELGDKALEAKLEAIIFPAFDFREMSRRCLGKNWKKANPEQQKEFVDLFSSLLSRTYVKHIVKGANTAEISFVGEKVKGKKAIVKTKVKDEDNQIAAVDYRLRNKKEAWRVYDVIIENVGLVSNYRSEFAGIIRNEEFSGLLTRLREKESKPPAK